MPSTKAESSYTRLHRWLEGFPGFESHVDQVDIPGAGRGLIASTSLKAEEPLLLIPAPALLNPLTLLSCPLNSIPAHLFPSPPTLRTKKRRTSISGSLNTTQLLTLHLVLTRDKEGRHPSAWQLYIDTIPQEFSWHPVLWKEKEPRRLEGVPRAARIRVEEVHRRFKDDLAVLKRVLDEEETFKDQDLGLSIEDFLWAWLCVNTRTVSLPLGYIGPTELYNHTLVPILDLINHSSSPTIPRPRHIPNPSASAPRKAKPLLAASHVHLPPGRTAFKLVAPEEGLLSGQEVTFQYHSQCNLDLWAEYGFAETTPAGPCGKWGKYSASDVGHLVDEMWVRDAGKQVALEKIGCWGQHTLHPWPEYEASHGLLMTLRVLHLGESERGKLESIGKAYTTYVSEENEEKVMESLREICRKSLEEVQGRLRGGGGDGEGENGEEYGIDTMVEALWEEQEDIARGCLKVYSS